MKNLYRPIKFKRWELAKWEEGFLRTNKDGVAYLEKDLKTVVNQVYSY